MSAHDNVSVINSPVGEIVQQSNLKAKESKTTFKPLHIIIGLLIMLLIMFLPAQEGLSIAGQRMLAVLAFAVYVWVTEAKPYPVSAIAICFLMIVSIGFAPKVGLDGPLLGTSKAIPLAMSGFINSGWVLVAAGMFLAEAVRLVGLDRRIALKILKIVGTDPRAIIGGVIVACYILAFIIPSIAARAAAIIPISMGLIQAFNVDYKSSFARQLMLVTGMSAPITALLVLTAGAPNPYTVSLLNSSLNVTITWMQWFIWAGPFAIGLGAILFLLVISMNKFEKLEGGAKLIERYEQELGPMSGKEKRMAWIFAFTILLWGTEHWHHMDANTITVFSALLLFLPYVGVSTWKQLSSRVDLGTLLVFGVGISIGEVLLKTGAAAWGAKAALGGLGLDSMTPVMMLATLAVPLIIIRLAFASIVAMGALVVPTVLGLLMGFHNTDMPVWGVTLISSFLVYFSFLLPVNTPATMLTYSTGTFELKDMLKLGIPLTILGVGLYILFAKTYWHWMGLI